MLYIFLVDTGSMMTFDMNLALQSVSNLKTAISVQCKIPEDKQVLLISGGESLDLSSRVCSYSCAGTDTSPIFLFSKTAIESTSPPKCVTDYGPDHDMEERVQSCIDMNPNYNTVVARAEMAQQLYEMAKQQLHNCERLVHDQHLQQQGWAAVVANLEDIASSFANSSTQLKDSFQQFVEDKVFYSDLLVNFNEDIKMLSKIPILPALLSTKQTTNESTLSLAEWISQKDSQNSLEKVAEHCLRGLEQFDIQQLSKVEKEVEEIMDSCNNSNMKEVKGLEERLYGLEKLMCEARKIVDEQRELAQAFYQNQTRASNLRDPSILPDLCNSHQQQLQVMLKNHQKLRDYRNRCSRAKEELSGNLHARLRWIMFIEKNLSEVDAKILVYRENLRRLKKHLEVVHQIHLAPKLYLASVVEVVRRKTFSGEFIQWSSSLAHKLSNLIDNEISMRQSFSSQLDSHFLQYLFPGMNDFPSRFANESPLPFDVQLPDLTIRDIEFLRDRLPDLTDMLVVPLPVPMPQPSQTESFNSQTNDFENNEKKVQNLKTSESDTEEFETFNNESPKWHDSDTKLASPVNENESLNYNKDINASETTDFLIEDPNNQLLKDVFINTSMTTIDISELESKLENFNLQSEELSETQENYSKSKEHLKSANLLIKSLICFSKDIILTVKEIKSKMRSNYSELSEQYISSLISTKEQLIDWLVLRESILNESINDYKIAVDGYEKRVIQLNETIESMESKLKSCDEELQSDKNKIQTLNEEISFKNGEINNLRDENSEVIKKMTLENELEMTTLSETIDKLTQNNQVLEITIDEKNNQLDNYKREIENMESLLLLRFQEEKDSLKNAMNLRSKERENAIRNELETKIKQIESNCESKINELRLHFDEEKDKALLELEEKLKSRNKNELESLRHRFKLAISTTSMERTPSESSLEKVQLDIVDQLAQDREINRLKQMIAEEKQRHEELFNQYKEEKENELKIIKSSYSQTSRCSDETINRLSNERKHLTQVIKVKDEALQNTSVLINDMISKVLSECDSSHEQLFDRIKSQIQSLVTKPDESLSSGAVSLCNCDAAASLKEKDVLITKLERFIRENNITSSTSTIGRIERVAVISCEVGDIVLIYYEVKFENFIVFSINNVLHFLHTDCWEVLSLNSVTGEQRSRWTIAEVTDKEYCQARKEPNRYKVALNTKFYRVKAKPWARMGKKSDDKNSFSVATISANQSASDPTVAMYMSTAPLEASIIPTFQMSQSCHTTKHNVSKK